MQTVKVKKLNEKAIIPTYGSSFAAGADLYACCEGEISINPGETVLIKTGIAMEIPENFVGLVYARSGLAPANKVGVIDADYRGEIMVSLHNHSNLVQSISEGERIAQLVIAPYLTANFVEAETLDETARGAGGFGSTGKK